MKWTRAVASVRESQRCLDQRRHFQLVGPRRLAPFEGVELGKQHENRAVARSKLACRFRLSDRSLRRIEAKELDATFIRLTDSQCCKLLVAVIITALNFERTCEQGTSCIQLL